MRVAIIYKPPARITGLPRWPDLALSTFDNIKQTKMPKLIFPQEIEVWYILPAIRKKIALKLVENGMSQKAVAEMMGITPAAVNQYKSKKRAKEEIFDKAMEQELNLSIKNIIQDPELLKDEIIRLNNLLKSKGILCKIYKNICALKKSKTCCYCNKNI